MWHYLSDAIGALFKMIFEEIFPLNLPKFDKIWLFSSKFIISFPQKTGKIRWAWYSKRFMRKFFLVMHYIYLIILNIQNLYLFKKFKKSINRWIINYKLKFCLKFVGFGLIFVDPKKFSPSLLLHYCYFSRFKEQKLSSLTQTLATTICGPAPPSAILKWPYKTINLFLSPFTFYSSI
jgi:hypothetical protein